MSLINHDSASVHNYLNNLQAIISRMANNSSSCKIWCITLVSATMALASSTNKSNVIWISIIPMILFYFLDAYYLGLEKIFRGQYNDFVGKLHSGTIEAKDLFVLAPKNLNLKTTLSFTLKAMISPSISPFYIILALLLIAISQVI